MAQNSVEKDVCEFYGISQEQYNTIVNGLGIADTLKEYGMEIDETKLSNTRERNKEKRRIEENETERIRADSTETSSHSRRSGGVQ